MRYNYESNIYLIAWLSRFTYDIVLDLGCTNCRTQFFGLRRWAEYANGAIWRIGCLSRKLVGVRLLGYE